MTEDSSKHQLLPGRHCWVWRSRDSFFAVRPRSTSPPAASPQYASATHDPAALQQDAFALSWARELGSVWINPPWASIPACLDTLEWPTQNWWPTLLALGGVHLRLPRPKICVRLHHGRLFEPFLNHGVQLLAGKVRRITSSLLSQSPSPRATPNVIEYVGGAGWNLKAGIGGNKKINEKQENFGVEGRGGAR